MTLASRPLLRIPSIEADGRKPEYPAGNGYEYELGAIVDYQQFSTDNGNCKFQLHDVQFRMPSSSSLIRRCPRANSAVWCH